MPGSVRVSQGHPESSSVTQSYPESPRITQKVLSRPPALPLGLMLLQEEYRHSFQCGSLDAPRQSSSILHPPRLQLSGSQALLQIGVRHHLCLDPWPLTSASLPQIPPILAVVLSPPLTRRVPGKPQVYLTPPTSFSLI